jgi:glutathione S-transferase
MSHPAHAARVMLDLKGVDYDLATVLPGMQRIHLRLAGFRGGTVPALKLDGRRVQGTRAIARALEARRADPPLFPADPQARARAEEAERWGDEELQPVPRIILRWGLVQHAGLRRWLAQESGLPSPGIAAHTSTPAAIYYARAVHADEAAVRRLLAALPGILDRVDALLAEGVLATEPPSAAALQVLCSVRALDAFADLHDQVASHPCAAAARAIFPGYPEPVPPFLPAQWLPAAAA